MIHETWSPVEEPVILPRDADAHDRRTAAGADDGRHVERAGPALTVWIIILLVAVVVILAVISYRRAPP